MNDAAVMVVEAAAMGVGAGAGSGGGRVLPKLEERSMKSAMVTMPSSFRSPL